MLAILKGLSVLKAKLLAFLSAFFVTLISIPLLAANFVLWCGVWLLATVTRPNFITLSYTDPSRNPIIQTGWVITRDLANIGIAVGLLIIGLATILQIESYQAKKTLPRLIAVALLINFSPLILGIIVDGSNILMRYFLGDFIDYSAFYTAYESMTDTIKQAWNQVLSVQDPQEVNLTPLGRSIALIAFGFIAGFVLLIFSFLFIFRHLAIWILTILSPLAFLFYIFPSTKGYFKKWWQEFLNWSFIGFTAAFFLYLSLKIIQLTQSVQLFTVSQGKGVTAALLSGLLPFIVVICFLVLGLFTAYSVSAQGANYIVDRAKTVHSKIGLTGRKAYEKVKQKMGEHVRQKTRLRGLAGWTSQNVEKVPLLRWTLPEKLKHYAEYRPSVLRQKEKTKNFNSSALANRILRGALVGEEATGALLNIIDNEDAQEIFGAGEKIFGKDYLNNKTFLKRMGRALEIAKKSGFHSTIFRKDPRLAKLAVRYEKLKSKQLPSKNDIKTIQEKLKKAKTEDEKEKYKKQLERLEQSEKLLKEAEFEAVKNYVSEARANHISAWDPKVLEDQEVIAAMMSEFDRDRWLQVNRQVKNGQSTALHTMDKIIAGEGIIGKEFEKFKKGKKFDSDVKALQAFIREKVGNDRYFLALNDNRFRNTGWRFPGEKPGTPPSKEERGEKVPTIKDTTTSSKAPLWRVSKKNKKPQIKNQGKRSLIKDQDKKQKV